MSDLKNENWWMGYMAYPTNRNYRYPNQYGLQSEADYLDGWNTKKNAESATMMHDYEPTGHNWLGDYT